MVISYTYLYELINEDTEEVFYIGKTNNPQRRFSSHRSSGGFINLKFKMKIIKKFVDIEDETINIYINEGYKLLNVRKNDYILKEYEVGSIIKHDPFSRFSKNF